MQNCSRKYESPQKVGLSRVLFRLFLRDRNKEGNRWPKVAEGTDHKADPDPIVSASAQLEMSWYELTSPYESKQGDPGPEHNDDRSCGWLVNKHIQKKVEQDQKVQKHKNANSDEFVPVSGEDGLPFSEDYPVMSVEVVVVFAHDEDEH